MAIHYTYASVTDARDALASRLYDPTFQQWTATELTALITEAIRTWNALSGFWRAEFAFPLQQNVWWYDLRSQANSLIPLTVLQNDLVRQIQNHLLEPPTVDAWTGSLQFGLADIWGALRRRQDETLGQTACSITRGVVNAPIGGRIVLTDNVIDIRRVAWLPADSTYSNKVLLQSDMWAARAFDRAYTVAGERPPKKWMQNTEPPPSFDVDSVPPVNGQYDVLTVQSGGVWVGDAAALLSVPDDWSWVVKWGALGDLLSRESNAQDVIRAEYCQRRYAEGQRLLIAMPTILALRLNNIPVSVGAVLGGDKFNPRWQAASAGRPKSFYTAANLLAASPKPDQTDVYSATASVVQNAPIDSAFIQVPRDDFDTVIEYAQHLGMFKQGGEEFLKTIPLYINMQKKAASYNSKLREMGLFSMSQLDLGTLEEMRNPRFTKEAANQ